MVIIIFGVSGAGKTTVGELLARELGWHFYEADDFHSPANIEKMRRGVPLTDDDRWPWLENLRELIKRCVAANENAVLACSALKRVYRKHLRVSAEVKLVFLRGDYALIAEQLRHRRGHFMNPRVAAKSVRRFGRTTAGGGGANDRVGTNPARACRRDQNKAAADERKLDHRFLVTIQVIASFAVCTGYRSRR